MAENINAAESVNEQTAQVENPNADVRKFDVTIKRVQTIINPETGYTSVQLGLDKPIPGFVQDDAGNYVEADVDHVSFTRGSLTRQLCELNEDVATLRDCSESAFDRKVFAIVLRGAHLTLRRTLHKKGEVIHRVSDDTDYTLERDQWFTELIKAQLSQRALDKIDDALTL